MTYNTWIFFCVLIGTSVGYFIFGSTVENRLIRSQFALQKASEESQKKNDETDRMMPEINDPQGNETTNYESTVHTIEAQVHQNVENID
ncbi:DgyrCDS10291 [Dimorphilus gyrociliatus]|uniref:Copper transport protein n=1 Tax=Dimorphilus gyrociliatus TaxID=2664684 RepID=A0A7I8VZZ2_9ANNE|nr:DgyrCDS10291 [Dimorphilus gyrociliatus]